MASQRESILGFKSPEQQQNFLLFGFNGHDFLTGAATAGQEYYCLEAWGGAATVDYAVTDTQNGTDAKSSITIAEGARVYGRLTDVEVTAGEVIAYKTNILP